MGFFFFNDLVKFLTLMLNVQMFLSTGQYTFSGKQFDNPGLQYRCICIQGVFVLLSFVLFLIYSLSCVSVCMRMEVTGQPNAKA